MTRKWIEYNSRVKCVHEAHDEDYQQDVYYICLDGAFHSWVSMERGRWFIRTVSAPNFPVVMGSFSRWIDDISK